MVPIKLAGLIPVTELIKFNLLIRDVLIMSFFDKCIYNIILLSIKSLKVKIQSFERVLNLETLNVKIA